jgi:FkbH-like protein
MVSESANVGLGFDSTEWIEIQGKLISGSLSRLEISDLLQIHRHSEEEALHLRVWRNFAVEPMENAFRALGMYWGVAYRFEYMGYDDSFSFSELSEKDHEVDCELLFVDRSHYHLSDDEFISWIHERERYLANITQRTVVTVIADAQIVFRMESEEVSRISGGKESFYDQRYERTTGSRLAPRTHFIIAQELSTSWIASIFVPPRKLIAVDLDFTLHDGVLGELQNEVQVNGDFLALQTELIAAKKRGYMLAILSKNNHQDVLDLLLSHPDYLLRKEDFVAIEASWDSKQIAMERILAKTRINQDAVIFIDDNPIELLQMMSAFPQVAVVSAAEGPAQASQTLQYVPGYRRQSMDSLGETRIRDIQSNEEREALIVNGLNSYYRSASPTLGIAVRNEGELERLLDLGKRSNQFNLTLARLGIAEYKSQNSVWVSLSLRDKFSDSGIIGGLLLKKTGDERCQVEELFLSCRVLGRGLETSLLCRGILEGSRFFGITSVVISWVIGERNEPGLKWLSESLLEGMPSEPGSVTMSNSQLVSLSVPPQGVEVEVKD